MVRPLAHATLVKFCVAQVSCMPQSYIVWNWQKVPPSTQPPMFQVLGMGAVHPSVGMKGELQSAHGWLVTLQRKPP